MQVARKMEGSCYGSIYNELKAEVGERRGESEYIVIGPPPDFGLPTKTADSSIEDDDEDDDEDEEEESYSIKSSKVDNSVPLNLPGMIEDEDL
jgi:hypothetical protein